jgi:hypothetical protein
VFVVLWKRSRNRKGFDVTTLQNFTIIHFTTLTMEEIIIEFIVKTPLTEKMFFSEED